MNLSIKRLLRAIFPIKVYTLVGRSGTGKSFRAQILADKLHIPIIVDDGLLIKKNRIIAGKSAKQEDSFAAAVNRALFRDQNHLEEALKALSDDFFTKILIIGTSDKMVERIAKTLRLPAPKVTIRIEDIATKDEIDMAMRIRYTEGKHVIPVAPLQISRSYPHIIYDSIKVAFRNRLSFLPGVKKTKESTLVCPQFGQHTEEGQISKAAFTQMVRYCIPEYSIPLQVSDVSYSYSDNGYNVSILLRCPSEVPKSVLNDIRDYVVDSLEKYGSILISSADVSLEVWGERPSSLNS